MLGIGLGPYLVCNPARSSNLILTKTLTYVIALTSESDLILPYPEVHDGHFGKDMESIDLEDLRVKVRVKVRLKVKGRVKDRVKTRVKVRVRVTDTLAKVWKVLT
jgi:hypothetical protein